MNEITLDRVNKEGADRVRKARQVSETNRGEAGYVKVSETV